MKLLQDKYSMNDTVHLTAVPGISVAKGGERELASAEVQESDTVRYVGPFDLRGGQAVFRFDGGHIYISLKDDHQPHFFYYHLKDHLGSNRVTKVGVGEGGSVLQRRTTIPLAAASAMAWAAQCRTISTQARSWFASRALTGWTTVHGGMTLQYCVGME